MLEEKEMLSEEKEKKKATLSRRSVLTTAEIKQASSQGVPLSYFEEMKEIFKIFDADGSGAIDPKEIREQMVSLGFRVDNTTIYQLISDLDSDGSQKLEFDEFFGMLRDTLKIHKPVFNTRDQFGEVFDFLDDLDARNRDGRIDASNLRRLANVLGDDITDSQIELMVQGADRDNKGYVLPEEFYQLMESCAAKMDEVDEDVEHRYPDDISDTSSVPSGSRTPRLPSDKAKTRSSMRKMKSRHTLEISSTSPKRDRLESSGSSRSTPRRSSTGGSGALSHTPTPPTQATSPPSSAKKGRAQVETIEDTP